MEQLDRQDVDFLAAMLHGRRAGLAEGGRLDRLCQIRTLPELSRVLGLAAEASPLILQRTLVEEFFAELSALAGRLPGAAGEVLAWSRVRFQVENLKVLARGRATGRPMEMLAPHLLPLPRDLQIDTSADTVGGSLPDILDLTPKGPLRESLQELDEADRAASRSFLVEAALDRGYLREWRRRADAVGGLEGDQVVPLARQEIDGFHLGLAARGIWIHHLEPDRLAPLYVKGASLSRSGFTALLGARDLSEQANLARGHGIDDMPGSIDAPDAIEALAWNRLLRLANRAFRRSHLGVGAVVAFTVLRRLELANLITLSEGIRAGVSPAALRRRLIPRLLVEAAHV